MKRNIEDVVEDESKTEDRSSGSGRGAVVPLTVVRWSRETPDL